MTAALLRDWHASHHLVDMLTAPCPCRLPALLTRSRSAHLMLLLVSRFSNNTPWGIGSGAKVERRSASNHDS